METNDRPRFNLDLCIIAAEYDLPRLENTLKILPNVDNIYILETQKSTDGEDKVELVNSAGNIHHYRWYWNDTHFHFANARNKAFGLSDNEWIMWLDCDDSLHPHDCAWINSNLPSISDDIGGIMFACAGLAHFDGIPLEKLKDVPGIGVENWGYWSSPTIRILRRKAAKFTGRVHEQVLDSIHQAGFKLMISDMVVKHRGYVTTLDNYINKMKRNIELLNLQLEEESAYDGIYMEYLENSKASLKGLLDLKDTMESSSSA